MINFAVMTFMYKKWAESENGSQEKLLEIIADSGGEGIEAFVNYFLENDHLISLYQKEMKNTGLKMPVMDLLTNLALKEKTAREEAYEFMRKGIDICESFGTEIIHLAGCSLKEKDVSPQEARSLIAKGMSDFVDDIEKRGMVLAFEDFDPSPDLICSADDCLEILKQADDRVKFVFDTGNFEASDEKAEDNFTKLIDRTTHFHFKDFKKDEESKRGYSGTYFGKGFINNSEIAEKIKSSGYNGWVALESYPQDGNGPEETVAPELAVLKSLF